MKATETTAAMAVTCSVFLLLQGAAWGAGTGFSFAVTHHDPASGATAVALGAPIQVAFSSGVDTGSLHAQSFKVWGDTTGFYEGSWSEGPLTFTPTSEFRPGEAITVMMSDGVLSTNGACLEPYQFSFRTEAYGTENLMMFTNQLISTGGCAGVALGDLDADGDLDLFSVTDATTADVIYLNDGSGTFSTGQVLGVEGSHSVALGDLDDDGDLDAYVLKFPANDAVYLNDGFAQFTNHTVAGTSGSFPKGVDLGDVNGDGTLDVFVVVYDGPDYVALNDGAGGFSIHQSIDALGGFRVALGDLDGDGDLDAYVTSAAPDADIVYLNDGSGAFVESQYLFFPCIRVGVDLGDIDGDGDLDAVVGAEECYRGSAGGQFRQDLLYVNDGRGRFAGVEIPIGEFYYGGLTRSDMDLGDFDGERRRGR